MLEYQSPAVNTAPLLACGGSLVWFGWLSLVRSIITYVAMPYPV